MQGKLRRILLIVNLHKEHALRLCREICAVLEKMEIEAVPFTFDGKPGAIPPGPFDLAFSLGGDGTVLYAARAMAPLGVPILPINLGTLGFIAAVHPEEWNSVFEHLLRGSVPLSQRLMLEAWVERDGKSVATASCLNDVVVSSSGIAKIIRLHVKGEKIRLGNYRSDGLIAATPTGSTAYSVAAGGPIVDPEMEAVIISPICPFSLSNRPMVVPADEAIIVEVEAEQRSEVLLTMDGQIVEPLEPGDTVRISRAPFKAQLIASDREVFYRVLHSKLNWSGGPDA
ncbi:NAD(+)/NADH kinase [Breznakiella homolactica]|uniref:NAD kinase n=1 Tax=Breznakiella homolactica TaxID=2798577 RepID=A0A7T8B8F8_9SPIR|nr:NAD(+)/NADH kinase [Breznakiella homolactica]QQO08554.1 NAD(+)/NADH kinase [Breznakiella homolactica]